MVSGDKNPHVRKRFAPSSKAFSNTAVAAAFRGSLDDAAFPPSKAWRTAKPMLFDSDWQGKNADAHRQTEVRLLWTPEFLYVRFVARFRRITVFENADADGRRDKLWDRDVAEVFLQPDPQQTRRYKEFEVSPNGFWIDLEIANGALQHIKSGLQRRVSIDEPKKTWTAELAIPMKSLTQTFGPASLWRVNFFSCRRTNRATLLFFLAAHQHSSTKLSRPRPLRILKIQAYACSKTAKKEHI